VSSDHRTVELEAELRRGFDRETLAVYADHLQSRGDPRGELIAIDLHADEHALSPELHERRAALLLEQLGDLATHPAIVCSHGFLDLVGLASMEVFDELLFRPFSSYLRTAILRGTLRPRARVLMTSQVLRALVGALAERPRPWLTALELHGGVRLPRTIAARLVAQAPRLERLAIAGSNVWPAVPYPGVRILRLMSFDAIPALLSTDSLPPCFPDVVEIEVEVRANATLTWEQQRALFPPAQLPALRVLDLSRCEVIGFDLFRCLRHLAILPQLEILRLGSILGGGMRTEADRTNVQAALDRMPRLARLEVRGGHMHLRDALQHPTATIIRRTSSEI